MSNFKIHLVLNKSIATQLCNTSTVTLSAIGCSCCKATTGCIIVYPITFSRFIKYWYVMCIDSAAPAELLTGAGVVCCSSMTTTRRVVRPSHDDELNWKNIFMSFCSFFFVYWFEVHSQSVWIWHEHRPDPVTSGKDVGSFLPSRGQDDILR